MKLRTVIADDEPLARRLLASHLANAPDLEVVGECRNGDELIRLLKEERVDLLFLDIRMPGTSGLEAIETIGAARMPLTIFVTAHSEYALHAFDVQALDYLTKPIQVHRLVDAIDRARERLAAKAALQTQSQMQSLVAALASSSSQVPYLQRLLVPDGDHDNVIPVEEIDWIEAADYYTCLHVGKKSYMLHQTTKQLAESLDPSQFIRVHRSAIVNINRVRQILREGRSELWVVLASGQRLKMSRAGWQSLLAVSGR